MSKSFKAPSSASSTALRPEEFAHSPVHYAVAIGDHARLSKIVSTLPKLANPLQIHTESDSLAQEKLADQISSVLDVRDNVNRETPLHLAVRLNDVFSVRTLSTAGADSSLQNADGWNPLQEAVLRRSSEIVKILFQDQHMMSWSKWRRRLPRLIAGLKRMRDFYMEISFNFESSIVPFIGKITPSDTYKIWKRDGNLRADTTLASYDGMKFHRTNQSYLFLGDGNQSLEIAPGSLLILNHDKKKIYDAFENAGNSLSEEDVSSFCNQTSVYRPGMDVTKAELICRTNWRRQEKTENVGEWKAKVYEVHNVFFSFRSRKITSVDGTEQILPLELEEDSEDGFLVAENPRFSVSGDNLQGRRHSSFIREDRDFVMVSRKSVDIIPEIRRKPPLYGSTITVAPPPQTKNKEFLKSLKPFIWLTEQFPLKTEELLPLLDILANKVKAIRRMRELLTTTFPPGTFPVKLAIPVVPTVRVVITFTKFVELQPLDEEFHTPVSSPAHFEQGENSCDDYFTDANRSSFSSSSSSSSSWLSRSYNRSSSSTSKLFQQQEKNRGDGGNVHHEDPFAIPSGYVWSSFDNKSEKKKKCKSSSSKKAK